MNLIEHYYQGLNSIASSLNDAKFKFAVAKNLNGFQSLRFKREGKEYAIGAGYTNRVAKMHWDSKSMSFKEYIEGERVLFGVWYIHESKALIESEQAIDIANYLLDPVNKLI